MHRFEVSTLMDVYAYPDLGSQKLERWVRSELTTKPKSDRVMLESLSWLTVNVLMKMKGKRMA